LNINILINYFYDKTTSNNTLQFPEGHALLK